MIIRRLARLVRDHTEVCFRAVGFALGSMVWATIPWSPWIVYPVVGCSIAGFALSMTLLTVEWQMMEET